MLQDSNGGPMASPQESVAGSSGQRTKVSNSPKWESSSSNGVVPSPVLPAPAPSSRTAQGVAICIEDLKVAGMVGNRKLSRAVADSGWRTFRMLLEYKADLYGRDLEAVSGWETASRVCSVCGQREGRKPLCVRAWRCPACGAEQDRDINAARNILAAGQVERFNGRGARSKTGSPASWDAILPLVPPSARAGWLLWGNF